MEYKFCDFVKYQSLIREVFSDEYSLAFLDIKPVFEDHCLIIPKKHFETLMDTPEGVVSDLFGRLNLSPRL